MFIIWETKKELEKSLIVECKEYLKSLPKKRKREFYTTYQKLEGLSGTPMDQPFRKFYSDIVSRCIKELGLHHTCKYDLSMWVQMYDHTTVSHGVHSHFCGDHGFSWVHFMDVPKQKCFYFFDSFGKKHYPEHQKSGDFIAFPSWALHGCDEVKQSGERIIVAGNINFYRYKYDDIDMSSTVFENTVLWVDKLKS